MSARTERGTTAESGSALRDEPFHAEVISDETVYRGAIWQVKQDRIRYGSGELTRQYIDHPGAAAVVAIDDEGRVLLIQQYRHPVRYREWELPAGLLDVEGEPALQAAQRELAEETDLVAEHWEPLVSAFATPGSSDEIYHLFLARGIANAAHPHAREDEEADIRVAWVPLADAVAAVMDGRMRNALLALGVLAAERRLRG